MAYVVKNDGSWVLFTKSNYLLNRALLNRGLGVYIFLEFTEVCKSYDYFMMIHYVKLFVSIKLARQTSVSLLQAILTSMFFSIVDDEGFFSKFIALAIK